MSTQTERVRFHTTIEAETAALIADKATQWQVPKGEVVDRLVRAAIGQESAERQATQGRDVLEETLRRVLDDATVRLVATLRTLLDERLELPLLEATTSRLLLFALLSHLTSPEAAVRNEDEALRVARQARTEGRTPLLLRGKGR